jgi:ArsR family transcriptional regulator
MALKDGERCVCEIFSELGEEQSLISHHLKTLRKSGIVKYRREGKKIMYRLADPSVLDLLTKAKELADAFCRVR